MPNPTYPMLNTMPANFLHAMRTGTMHLHPEFLQETGNWKMAAAAEELRELGWEVAMVVLPAPTLDNPNRYVAFYYLEGAEHTLRAAFGSEEGM